VKLGEVDPSFVDSLEPSGQGKHGNKEPITPGKIASRLWETNIPQNLENWIKW
jgi:hypothetical protein